MSKFHSLPEDDEVLLLVARFQPPAVVHGLGHHQDPGVYNIYIILYYSHKIFWGPQRTPEWNVSNQLAIQHPSPCGKLRKIKSQKKKVNVLYQSDCSIQGTKNVSPFTITTTIVFTSGIIPFTGTRFARCFKEDPGLLDDLSRWLGGSSSYGSLPLL